MKHTYNNNNVDNDSNHSIINSIILQQREMVSRSSQMWYSLV